jgi:hypothetical protein
MLLQVLYHGLPLLHFCEKYSLKQGTLYKSYSLNHPPPRHTHTHMHTCSHTRVMHTYAHTYTHIMYSLCWSSQIRKAMIHTLWQITHFLENQLWWIKCESYPRPTCNNTHNNYYVHGYTLYCHCYNIVIVYYRLLTALGMGGYCGNIQCMYM